MGRVTDTNIAGSTGEKSGQKYLPRKDQSQRTWPEVIHQFLQNRRHLSCQLIYLGLLSNQHQDSFVGLALFNGKETLKGLDIEGINAETVIGLCGKGNQAALTKQTSCLVKSCRI
jgi:hypothetical protein